METGDKTEDKIDVAESGQTFFSDSTALVSTDESHKVNIGELPLFTFEIIAKATKQFHESNHLGRGGFGHVYKVIMDHRFLLLHISNILACASTVVFW